MTTMHVALRSIPGTGAAIGWADTHTVVVDRPAGRSGGSGLGFNGGQLLALAIGGCLCNDLHYAADAANVRLAALAVDVSITFDGHPPVGVAAEARVSVRAADPAANIDALVEQVRATSTVSNTLARGLPVQVINATEEAASA
jgi:organic hydroperoxide reductase OsmC/OhrA